MNFFDTVAGHEFVNRTIPKLVRNLEKNNELLEKNNQLLEKLVELKEQELKPQPSFSSENMP